MTAFLVSEFGKSAISNLVKESFGSDFPDVYNKTQVDYLFRYLQDLGAKSVLLESEYVDKDYLDDHSKFYVRRFANRGHKCARLHFFAGKWEHVDFDQLLAHGGPQSKLQRLQSEYLGFMVVKPLPKTFIGKTCLRPYRNNLESTKKRTCLHRAYTTNLFGIKLEVESIAFQEQDNVISACATTSIWSALNALKWINVRDIPSCCEITIDAINFIPDSNNSFPSKELSQKQILRAIDCQGLRHHSYVTREAISQNVAQQIIESHIRSGLPMILGADVYEIYESKKLKRRAGHAITIVGYNNSDDGNCLYVHDNRLGPFARATFADPNDFTMASGASQIKQQWGLTLQKKNDDGQWQEAHEVLVPNLLISVTDKKVRLWVQIVLDTCDLIKRIYDLGANALAKKAGDAGSNEAALDFDVTLVETSYLKREILLESKPSDQGTTSAATETSELNLSERNRVRFLTQSFARYQWVAQFRFGGSPVFAVLFDATEISQGDAVSAVYVYHEENTDAVKAAIGAICGFDSGDLLGTTDTFIASFLRHIRPAREGLQEHLNKSYGEPRAPRRLKASEVRNGGMVENTGVRTYYEAIQNSLADEFPNLVKDDQASYLLWVIDHEGTLLIGAEIDELGHPALTGYKPARIAGELRRTSTGWIINSKSGRYSGNYHNSSDLLANAVHRFKGIFYKSREEIRPEPPMG